ncbi:MAG: peptidase [Haloplasmataceae bacterium]|jgi:regulator of protease activity HflC (stomatin/prohibitin superfamily)|nr:peptidase [Haloplasmataceae bacterium]
MEIFIGFLVVLFGILLLIVVGGFRIVPQSKAYVVERLGSYSRTWNDGLHWHFIILEHVVQIVNLKEQVSDFKPQPVITRDNVTMQIDTVVFHQITDSKLFAYGVTNPMSAIENLTATTLRNIIGELELDETLTSRDVINTRMRAILDEATDPWGIKINRVEVKNILPPRDIQEAMEKQMRAERERRAAILTAEGQKQAAILSAEGEKQAAILRAEANKQSQILAAEAEKESKIRRAEGEADAIVKVQTATAEGLKVLNASAPTQQVLTLKAYETFIKVADGQATKIIIPSEIQNLAGLIASATEIAKKDEKK